MSRSLPLGAESTVSEKSTCAVAVYDPAMCCPTGICGPGVDPALLQITRDLRWLQAQGVAVSRHGLTTDPDAFAANARIAGLLATFGEKALPVTLVHGSVLVHGRYPSRQELVCALGSDDSRSDDASKGSAR
jgi:hypothetical protein